MEAHNINGTSKKRFRKPKCNCKRKCSSWIGFYFRHGGRKNQKYCSARQCNKPLQVGAHVQINSTKRWQIVPFCSYHNNIRTTRTRKIILKIGTIGVNVQSRMKKKATKMRKIR